MEASQILSLGVSAFFIVIGGITLAIPLKPDEVERKKTRRYIASISCAIAGATAAFSFPQNWKLAAIIALIIILVIDFTIEWYGMLERVREANEK